VSLRHWTQAVIPEVYALNTFFMAAFAWLLIRLAERPSPARLITLAAAAGLSCANHTTAFAAAGLAAVAALLIAPSLFKRPAVLLGALAAGLLPLALYLVLIPASLHQPYLDWGNPETLPRWWAHVTRSQYTGWEAGQRATAGPYGDYLRRLSIIGQAALRQFGTGWVLVLAVIGFFGLFVRQTGCWLFLVALGWLYTVGVTRYMGFTFDREFVYANQIYWIPTWMVLAWLVAGGLDVLLSTLRRPRRPQARWAQAGATVALGALIALPAATHYPIADRSGTTLVRDFGRAVLDVMEEGALYFPSSDHSTFAVLYQQGVLGYRTDVAVADRYGDIEPDVLDRVLTEDDRSALDQLSGSARRRAQEALLIRRWPGALYCANKRDMSDVEGLVAEPCGPIFRILSEEEAERWWRPAEDGTIPGLAIWDELGALVSVEESQKVDITVQIIEGDMLYLKGFAHLRAGQPDEAIACWSRIGGDLAPLKQIFNNIGSALAEHGRTTEALDFYGRALQEDAGYLIALRNKTLVHRSRGETSAAIDGLKELVEREADPRGARLELARLLAREDRVVESLAQYEALAVSDRSDPLPWREAGQLLQRIGDDQKAEDAYVEALRLDPDQVEVAQALARVRQGVEAWAEGEPPPAAWTGQDPHEVGTPVPPGEGVPGMPADPSLGLAFDPTRERLPQPRR
jgi:tetratricopeptide (TPR) repeat protein